MFSFKQWLLSEVTYKISSYGDLIDIYVDPSPYMIIKLAGDYSKSDDYAGGILNLSDNKVYLWDRMLTDHNSAVFELSKQGVKLGQRIHFYLYYNHYGAPNDFSIQLSDWGGDNDILRSSFPNLRKVEDVLKPKLDQARKQRQEYIASA